MGTNDNAPNTLSVKYYLTILYYAHASRVVSVFLPTYLYQTGRYGSVAKMVNLSEFQM